MAKTKKKSEFDFKKFMLEKGERVGLYVAGGFAALLIVLGVMVGLGKTSPVAELKRNTDALNKNVDNAKPPPMPATMAKPDFVRELNPDTFGTWEWITRFNMEDKKRRNPLVMNLLPKTQVDVMRVPLQVMDFNELQQVLQWLIPADKPAEIIRPTHMVIIHGVFPYQEQLKQFQWALRVKKKDDTRKPDDGKAEDEDQPAGAGVTVYRRDIGPDGRVRMIATADGKETDSEILDLDSNASKYKKILSITLEPPALEEKSLEFVLPGFAMPLLQLAGKATYKTVELPGLPPISVMKKTEIDAAAPPRQPAAGGAADGGNKLVPMKLKDKTLEAKPELVGRLTGENVDIFEPTKGLKGDKDEKKDNSALENCLFRFIDVDVQPGHTYEYAVEIYLVNPNYNKFKEVASRSYAKVQFLHSALQPIGTAYVPYDVEFFAIDELALDPANYKGTAIMMGAEKNNNGTARAVKQGGSPVWLHETNVAVQIHKWVESVGNVGGVAGSGLGDWLIAERLLVHRGDPIGHTVAVDAPRWDELEGKFIIPKAGAKTRPTRGAPRPRQQTGTDVDFNTQALLVDFQGGQKQRLDAKNTLVDHSAVELLVLNADGKLQVRNGRTDSADKERKERYTNWRDWINVLTGVKKEAGAMFDNPRR